MAAVELTITGVLYDKTARTTQPVVIIGEASLTGLGIGGGPIFPDPKPPGIWGPTDPRPTPPIANVPGLPPTQNPPGWGLHPAHPIVIPDPVPPNYHPEHPIVLPPDAPPYPQNPAVMPAGTIMPYVDVPGSGTVWLLGNFPGYGWRWVAVDAGAPPTMPTPPAKPR